MTIWRNVYLLIEEDFLEYEPVLEANFKIMLNECLAIVDSEEDMPKPTMVVFRMVLVRLGATVFDTQKTDLETERIDWFLTYC